MLEMLQGKGAIGLDTDKLILFPFSDTGRGIMTLVPHKKGTVIFTIPETVFLTASNARADLYLGELLKDAHTPLTDDDVLAIYILYINSRESSRFDHYKSYLNELPTQYTSSVFFTDKELDICAGSSLYTVTKVLQQQIENDYDTINKMLFERFPDVFPSGVFTFERVSVYFYFYFFLYILN
jgi:SET domain